MSKADRTTSAASGERMRRSRLIAILRLTVGPGWLIAAAAAVGLVEQADLAGPTESGGVTVAQEIEHASV